MHQCCVFGCRNVGGHSFPKDVNVRKLWESATRCKNFRAKKHSKVCAAHFKSEDFIKIGKYSGLENTRRILKKGIVPSIFSWTKTEDIKSRQRRERAEVPNVLKQQLNLSFSNIVECHDLAPIPNDTVTCNTSSATAALDFGVHCIEQVLIQENSACNSQLVQIDIPSIRECATQKNYQFYTIESFRNDDKGIAFYTGFETFDKFMFVFNTLCPEAYSLVHKGSQVLGLSAEDQFLLTLMKLRRNKEDYELGRFFGVSPSTVSDICITWINFMHQMWSMFDIWPKRELVDFCMPEEFKTYYPSTKIIEIPIQQPTNPAAQSSYKNLSTVKCEVGASPGGLVSHCSEAYAGRASDMQSTVESSQLYQMCEKGDSTDRGFNVQDIFAHKCIAVNAGMAVVKLSSKSIHIERLIDLTKTYFIFQNSINKSYVPLMSKIYFVCDMMCNFRENIVKTTA